MAPTRQQQQQREEQETPTAEERDAIARLAYSLWEERGGGAGSDLDDWLRAEEIIRGAGDNA